MFAFSRIRCSDGSEFAVRFRPFYAMEAAGQSGRDTLYGLDIFTDAIPSTPQITLAESFVRLAGDVTQMSADRFIAEFNTVWEAVDDVEGSTYDRLLRFWNLHRRHGQQVLDALSSQYKQNVVRLAVGDLPERCLLRIVPGKRRRSIDAAAEAIVDRLKVGLPLAFRHGEPINEVQVQDNVHSILSGYRDDFQREHPGVRFLGKEFRPDFAPGLADLFVEIKYPHGSRRKTQIVEDIAADVTTARVTATPYLFIIYDPHKWMIDEAAARTGIGLMQGEPIYVAFIR